MRLLDLVTVQQTDPNKASTKQSISFAGFPITIEYPKGSTRELKNDDGKVVYKRHMFHSYGFIRNTEGRDTDEVDVILGPTENAKEAYVIHMIDKGPDVKEREDEDKVYLGFQSGDAAKQAFFLSYPKNFFGGMSVMSVKDFKSKLASREFKGEKIHCRSLQ